MNQTIKAGDYEYIPQYSRKALLVQIDDRRTQFVYINRTFQLFIDENGFNSVHNENGFNSVHNIEPIAFLANEENKERIEEFYGCELETSPLQNEINQFNMLFDYFLPDLQEKGVLVANKELTQEFFDFKTKVFELFLKRGWEK